MFDCLSVGQSVLKHRWSVLYLLLSLAEDPRKPSGRVRDGPRADSLLSVPLLFANLTKISSSGWKLRGAVRPGPPQGRSLHPVLLHPTPEPGPELRGARRRPLRERRNQRDFQFGGVRSERTHADAADTAGWVGAASFKKFFIKAFILQFCRV